MSEIDFGTMVSKVLTCMDFTESDLTDAERHDSQKALQHYKRDVAEEIRAVFDEADAPAPVALPVSTCSHCGAPVEEGYRFCGACRMPQTTEAAAETLERVFAKELGRSPYDPHFHAALARIREEEPALWDGLVQKITAPVKA